MWSIERVELGRGTRCWRGLEMTDRKLTIEDVWKAWRADEVFRKFWMASLQEEPFESYCWECPPVSDQNRSRPFECVFVPSPSLARMAVDREAFSEHFRAHCDSVTFGNLGGDAILVAPCPAGPGSDYGHLAQFARTAPQERQHAFWRAVGEAMESRVGAAPTWLSTAGHGVAWLHVRLDSRPKYYRHAEYART